MLKGLETCLSLAQSLYSWMFASNFLRPNTVILQIRKWLKHHRHSWNTPGLKTNCFPIWMEESWRRQWSHFWHLSCNQQSSAFWKDRDQIKKKKTQNIYKWGKNECIICTNGYTHKNVTMKIMEEHTLRLCMDVQKSMFHKNYAFHHLKWSCLWQEYI